MVWQFDWRGTRLENLRILVAPDMVDKPQRQLGTIILPPDPVAILNARPEQYGTEEVTFLLDQSGLVLVGMDGNQLLASNVQSTIFLTSDSGAFLTSDSGEQLVAG